MASTKEKPGKVVDIDRRSNRDIIDALEHLLAQARGGHIRGFGYVVQYTDRNAVGATGSFRNNPSGAIGPALDLFDALRAMSKVR